jgi:hypothetical protein
MRGAVVMLQWRDRVCATPSQLEYQKLGIAHTRSRLHTPRCAAGSFDKGFAKATGSASMIDASEHL